MDAQTHLTDTHLRLTISPIVLTYAVMEERSGIDYGYLRVQVELTNRDYVEMAEYFTVQAGVITGSVIAINGWMLHGRHSESGGTMPGITRI
jgi:hypothetical protein